MNSFRLRSLAFLLLLSLIATACTPIRSRGNGGGYGGDDDDTVSDDDDAAGDDDDAVGDDDDAVGDDDDDVGGDAYTGNTSGYLKSADGGGSCEGFADIRIDPGTGEVLAGLLTCGDGCEITFAGPFAFGEESFDPSFDCEVAGVAPEIFEIDAWIWGSAGSYTEGNVSGYGESDYFSLSFSAYPEGE